jgi:tight adherence protein C
MGLMARQGERTGRRGDSVAKAAQGAPPAVPPKGPPTGQALLDLMRLVRRSNAPQLPLRLAGAIGMTLGGKALGVLAPLVLVGQLAARRQQSIYATLPDTIDLLTACVEAGLGLDAAIGHMTRRRSRACWALNHEFARYQQELHMGVPRHDAMRNLANRCDVEDLRHLVNALAQGDALGVGISQVLRGQSQHLRLRRKQRAEEKAMKAPIKILFPLLIGVFPSLFVVILGPAALRLIDTFATR